VGQQGAPLLINLANRGGQPGSGIIVASFQSTIRLGQIDGEQGLKGCNQTLPIAKCSLLLYGGFQQGGGFVRATL